MDFTIEAGNALRGKVRIPGDKSISHRALMMGSIAEGNTNISGLLEGEDTLATLKAFQKMGVDVEHHGENEITVHGMGLHGLKAPDGPLYLGNSGTSVRLLSGLLAGLSFDSELLGDESLTRRPMLRITNPLQQMGADITCSEAGTLPLHIHGGRQLSGICYEMPVASAQLKSAILLAGLYASGRTCVIEPAMTRDHTERMLEYFGVEVLRNTNKICVKGNILKGRDIQIPADISSATFFMLAATIVDGSNLLMENISVNKTRSAVIDILSQMGAKISLENKREACGEAVADIRVKSSQLVGIEIPIDLVPIAIDEFPVILVIAAFAKGRTILAGATELRVKESDRIQAMENGLKELGIELEAREDGMVVEGGHPTGGVVDSYGDHRIAMAFSMAGLASSGPIVIKDCTNVNTSFPGFVDLLKDLEINITEEQIND